MTTRTLVAVTAGLSQPSSTRLLTDRLGSATEKKLAEAGIQAEVRVVELREIAREIADHLVTGFPGGELRSALEAVTAADGLIAVTPIFTASYSGLFKSFFDLLDNRALTGKPVLMGATGGSTRHSLALEHALRPMFAYLRAVVVPTAVYAASADWGTGGERADDLARRIDRAAGELAGLLAHHTAGPDPTDDFADLVPFEQQLAGGAAAARPAPVRHPAPDLERLRSRDLP